jgi:hypothetical protein
MNLFGDSDYLEKLSLKGDPLERLEKVVDFECFRPTLNRIFKYDLKNKSHGGRPPYDLVLMLKILILQRLYNLSDDAMEYQMIDRISFRRFLKIDDKVPDAKTIWNFRNQLSKSNNVPLIMINQWILLPKIVIASMVKNEWQIASPS